MAKKRSKSYSRTKGHKFEQKIAKELRELGFNVVTSRSESKSMDDNKVDLIDKDNKLELIDKDNKLPCAIQLKATQAIPSYFSIRNQSTVINEDFVILWAKQEKKEVNICTVGEAVIMDKQLFYKLIKPYADSSNI